MAGIGSYQSLKDQIETYLKRPDIANSTTVDTDELIRKAEVRITRMVRLPIQEDVIAYDLGTAPPPVDMPEFFLESKILMNSRGCPITIELNHIFFRRNGAYAADYPTKATRVGKQLYFWPNTSDNVTWVYYKTLTSILDTPEVENNLVQLAGSALLHAAVMEGAILTRNAALEGTHRRLMDEHLELLTEMAHRDTFAGTDLDGHSEYAQDDWMNTGSYYGY